MFKLNLNRQKTRAFTLLEILLVVGIIAILAGIVILALNPTKMFSQTRNVQRKANLAELNKALYQYYIDNSHYPVTLTTTLTEICATGASSTPTGIVCTGLINLSALVPTYLVAIPTDPQGSLSFLDSVIPTAYAMTNGTGYLVALNSASKPYLKADNAELTQTVIIGNVSGVLPDYLSSWSFDDAGSGTALDTMGINNGTINGVTATTGVRGIPNTAYAFDGVNDRISFVSALPSKTYSITFWMKSNSLSSRYFYDFRANSGQGFVWISGIDTFDVSSGTKYLNGNPYASEGLSNRNWTFLAISGITIKATSFDLGATYASNVFNGAIDNVHFYDRALTAEEIMNIYNAEKP